MKAVFRPVTGRDAGELLEWVRKLARFEGLSERCTSTAADLECCLRSGLCEAVFVGAEATGYPHGFALWYYSFSTFAGRKKLYIEDIFVEESMRGRGLGRALFDYLAERALESGCSHLEWSVLEWNRPAIAFYASVNAKPVTDWQSWSYDLSAFGTRHD